MAANLWYCNFVNLLVVLSINIKDSLFAFKNGLLVIDASFKAKKVTDFEVERSNKSF